jgi:hypothetical protein
MSSSSKEARLRRKDTAETKMDKIVIMPTMVWSPPRKSLGFSATSDF